MMEVLDELEYRDDVGVLVLTGEGSAWSAGMDLKEYFRETEAEGLARHAQGAARKLWLVAAAALVSEADDRDGQRLVLRRRLWPAVRLRPRLCRRGGAVRPVSEINWGILPGGGATKVAVELLPFRKAMYHAMMGENVDGKTAAEWGLVNEALPLDAARRSA